MTNQLLKDKPNLMGWVDNAEEAEDLFSNCSSNASKKSFPHSYILKQINEKIAKNHKKLH
jgi:hypothetical protein